jgi:hypothetical protein
VDPLDGTREFVADLWPAFPSTVSPSPWSRTESQWPAVSATRPPTSAFSDRGRRA